MDVCFCTLAIHAPYRQRARQLCRDLTGARMVVLTDCPSDFADLPVRAVYHQPTGPMAEDYRTRLARTILVTAGSMQGAAAYHDKRFALQAALETAKTAIFLDADSRVSGLPAEIDLPAGLCALPLVQRRVGEHLAVCGTWRLPFFEDVALEVHGTRQVLADASWCHESCLGITKDGKEDRFFNLWGRWAENLQRRDVYSGEGGVIGISAHAVGWQVYHDRLEGMSRCLTHEGGGPKAG
jgi:hypothetical protein